MSKVNTKKRSSSDWKRVQALKDRELNYSDIPPLDKDFFREAILWSGPKKQITLRLDSDVLDFFRKQGRGYQRNINSVLRRYINAQGNRAQS